MQIMKLALTINLFAQSNYGMHWKAPAKRFVLSGLLLYSRLILTIMYNFYLLPI